MWKELAERIYPLLTEEAKSAPFWDAQRTNRVSATIINEMDQLRIFPGKIHKRVFHPLRAQIRTIIDKNENRRYPIRCEQSVEDDIDYELGINTPDKKSSICIFFILLELKAIKMPISMVSLDTFFFIMGYNFCPTSYESMEDFITLYVIKSEQDFRKWCLLQRDWQITKNQYHSSMKEPFNDKLMTFENFSKLLYGDKGRKATINDIEYSNKLIAEACTELAQDLKRRKEETICGLFEDFSYNGLSSADIIGKILDAQIVRQWLFLDMINKGWEAQINAIIEAAVNRDSKRFKRLLKEERWFGKKKTDGAIKKNWSDITIKDFETLEDGASVLETLLKKDSVLQPGKVYKGFYKRLDKERYPGDRNGSKEQQCISADKDLVGNDELEATYYFLRQTRFEGAKYIHYKFIDPVKWEMVADLKGINIEPKEFTRRHYEQSWRGASRNGEALLRGLLTKKRVITKELLILTKLVISSETRIDDIYYLLRAARFPEKLGVFSAWYYGASSAEMERDYYFNTYNFLDSRNNGGRSLFYDILAGKELHMLRNYRETGITKEMIGLADPTNNYSMETLYSLMLEDKVLMGEITEEEADELYWEWEETEEELIGKHKNTK